MRTDRNIPIRQWPQGTSLQDYIKAATPEELHAVAIGLEVGVSPIRQQGAGIYEGLPVGTAPDRNWRRWYPTKSAPDWWRVQDLQGEIQCLVHFVPLDAERPTLGHLWLRSVANGLPLIYCPKGSQMPAMLVTPQPGINTAIDDEVEAMKVITAINEAPWPEPFRQLDASDPRVFTDVFGGYFMPGAHYFDQFMCMAVDRARSVPGFRK